MIYQKIARTAAVIAVVLVSLQCGEARTSDSSASELDAERYNAELSFDDQDETALCQILPRGDRQTFVLEQSGLGFVRTGLTRSDIQDICSIAADTVILDAEGQEVLVTRVGAGNSLIGLVEWTAEGNLARLRIRNARVSTVDSVRIGTSVSDLLDRFGALRAGYDDDGVYVWQPDSKSISYLIELSEPLPLASPDDVRDNPAAIPGESTVRELLWSER